MRISRANLFASVACAASLATAAGVAAREGPSTAPSAPGERLIIKPSKFSSGRIARQFGAMRSRDPIGFLAMDLSDITSLLEVFNTRDPVQPRQADVVAHLDELIAQLEKQAGAGGGGNPSRPMRDSQIAKGPGGSGPMHDPQSGTRAWGQLPAKEREQILQSQNEGFPPGFEAILSSYYKRLAQENVGADGSATIASNPSTTQPSTQPQTR